MSLASMVLRRPVSVWSSVCSAVTVTCSVSAPVASEKSIVKEPVASSWILFLTAFLNP